MLNFILPILITAAIIISFFLLISLISLLLTQETVLKVLGVCLLPIYMVRFVIDLIDELITGEPRRRDGPPKKFNKILREEDFPKNNKYSSLANNTPRRETFDEMMYRKRLEIEAETNKNSTGMQKCSPMHQGRQLFTYKTRAQMKKFDEVFAT